MTCFSKVCPEVKAGIYFFDDLNINILQINFSQNAITLCKESGAPTSSTRLKQIFSKSIKAVLGPTCPQICLIVPYGHFYGIFSKCDFYLLTLTIL